MADTMRAVTIHEFGDAGVLTPADAPRPEPGDGDVLVKVGAAGVNPIDYMTRSGAGVNRRWQEVPFPLILGWDICGTVTDSRSPDFTAGDEVFGMIHFPAPGGGYAEYATAPAGELAPKPAALSVAEAAGVPLVALTAWQALFVNAGLAAGQTVLIHAAAGGVGHFAVQLAKWKGARVIATASAKNRDFVMDLGADEFIDYTATDFAEAVSDVDVVFHTIPADFREASYRTLKAGGCLISITGPIADGEADAHGVRAQFISVRPNGGQLREIGGLIDDGTIRTTVEKTYPLAEAAAAQSHVEGGHARGKIVLTLD